jgi:hypothetical protein
MKKFAIAMASMLFIGGLFFVVGCTEDDTSGPVITLNGADPDVVTYKSAASYDDPGATATDAEDGTCTVTVEGTVNMNSAGEYVLTYKATDKAGNTSSKTRTVVVDAAPYLAAGYTVEDFTDAGGGSTSNGTYPETVTASSVEYNKINFTKFAFYVNGGAYATIAGSTITVPQQNITCGNPSALRTFTGQGTFTSTTMVINYTEVTNGTTVTGHGNYTKN